MTAILAGVRVLVADDQQDVARSLCRPLERAGARLRFADSGTAALAAAGDEPYDLILVDLKMPPDHWGGLWLLEQLHAEGLRIPAIVLSGEGAREQVKQAMRLDAAVDWVDKDDAVGELLERCATRHGDRQCRAMPQAIAELPAPLAAHLHRYERADGLDRKVGAGLAAVESAMHFAAVVGLATTPPTPLPGVTTAQLARPSMGTWLAVCTRLQAVAGAGSAFTRLFACLAPDQRAIQEVQQLVGLRNGIAHGRATPTADDAAQLDVLLRRFAARATAFWRAGIAVAATMTHDGTSFHTDFHQLRGTQGYLPQTAPTTDPAVTGQVFLLPHTGAPVTLAPWLVADRSPDSDGYHLFQIDGSVARPTPDSALRYANATDPGGPPPSPHTATWSVLAPWAP